MSDQTVRTKNHPASQGIARLPDRFIFGCAYYDEYMPYERVDKDMSMIWRAPYRLGPLGVSASTSGCMATSQAGTA